MKKILFLMFFISSFLNAINYEIICQNQSSSSDTKFLPFFFDSESYYDIWGDNNNFVDGSLDVVNGSVNYWSDESAICGGSLDKNIFIEAYCDDSINSSCWDVSVGISGIELITKNLTDGKFYNNVTYVNGYPCLPKETASFTIGLYSANTGFDYEIPFQNANLNTYLTTNVLSLTSVEADTFRNICSPVIPPSSDYSEQLNQLIQNTKDNNNIKELNERDKKLDNDLQLYSSNLVNNDTTETDLLEFETTFEATLNNSFLNYSNVFGFSGYGAAPAPISFSLLGQTFEVFNISVIDEYIDLIRTTFSIFAYLWGIIIVFRSV